MLSAAQWQIAGNLLSAASLWVGVIILARVATSDEVGVFAYAMSITAPVYMFFNLRLRLVLSTDTSNKYKHEQYILLRVITSFVALLIIISIAFLYVDMLALRYVIIIVAMAKLVGSISDIVYGSFQHSSKSDVVGKSMTIKSIITVSVIFLVVIQLKSATGLSFSLLVSWLFVLLLYDIRKLRSMNFKTHAIYDLKALKNLFNASLPLAFVALLSSIITNMPKYFIEDYLGTSALGVYAAIAYFSSAASLFAAGLGQPRLKLLADNLHKGNIDEFRFNLYKLISSASVVGVLGITISSYFGGEILKLLYGNEYQNYQHLFFLIMIASMLTMVTLFQWYAMTALRLYKYQLYISIFSVVLSFFMQYILLEHYNLEKAVLAEIIVLLVQVFIFFFVIEKNCTSLIKFIHTK